MLSFHARSPIQHVVAAALVALVLCVGLSRFGIWQPSELHVADTVRDGGTRPDNARPPLQWTLTRAGFRAFGPTEVGGRLPSALFAALAAIALGLAVGRASDARTGAFTAVAYATVPLVYLNARMMLGGGIAQSGMTLLFAAIVAIVWGRPPPPERAVWAGLWRYGRWVMLLAIPVAVLSTGVMLGVLPVLLGVSLAVALRWRNEPWPSRVLGLAMAVAAVALCVVCAGAAVHPPDGYSHLLGIGPAARPPATFPTWESVIEQIGLGLFPWTGIAVFGVVRLLVPPPTVGSRIGSEGVAVSLEDAWRDAGMRLGAFGTLVAALGIQTFHLQQFGVLPFMAAAPLAVSLGIALRDAEREARPWRLVTAGATFGAVIIMRDYLLFPKSSYIALGLPDGGPGFPTGFTGTLKEWFRAHGASGIVDVFSSTAPGEVYFFLEALLFILVSLAALFMGAGRAERIGWLRPFTWFADVERAARRDFHLDDFRIDDPSRVKRSLVQRIRPWFSVGGLLATVRWWVIAAAIAVAVFFRTLSVTMVRQPPAARAGLATAAYIPVFILIGAYAVVALWNLYAWVGASERPWRGLIGSRIALVPAGAVLVALMGTQLFMPALSEHLSPRGVWAVIRQVRREGEPVARYGGVSNDRATRYYASFEVEDIRTEPEAVRWLMERSPRHYLVVGVDQFPSLNHAYRATFPPGRRQNIPVLDSPGGAFYVTASDIGDRTTRNPLESVVLSADTLNHGGTDHWHAHGRREGTRTVEEPARFEDAIEYLGYNLDSNNRAYVPVGESFRITYHFRVLRALPGSYRMFVHLESPACARSVHDHDPGDGKWPVRLWLPGDYVHDDQRITVPAECRAGSYTVYIGFWQAEQRMAVTGGSHDAENRVVAAVINVR